MNLQDAVKIANQEMTKYSQLGGWVFRLDRSRSRFGCCDSRRHVISLSKALTLLNPAKEVLDTIRHEIAHALVGPEHGHDRIWKRMCMVVGARPSRCYDSQNVAAVRARWLAVCPSCGGSSPRHKRRTAACGKCCNAHHGGRYTDRFKLIYKPNV